MTHRRSVAIPEEFNEYVGEVLLNELVIVIIIIIIIIIVIVVIIIVSVVIVIVIVISILLIRSGAITFLEVAARSKIMQLL